MGISQEQAKHKILDIPATVLFIDTCIFLDIIRSPIRENINENSAGIAIRLIEMSQHKPKEIWLMTSETVQTEWLENIENVKLETIREVQKIEKRRRHFLAAAGSANGMKYTHGDIETTLKIEEKLELISSEFLNECLVITPQDIHSIRAMQRVKQYRPPARRGKAEAKDCEIFEVFIGICTELRDACFDKKLFFISSNTSDYPVNNSTIVQELDTFNGEIFSNLAWVMAGIKGHI